MRSRRSLYKLENVRERTTAQRVTAGEIRGRFQLLILPFFFNHSLIPCVYFLIATRETAFVHAMSSAAITHEITYKCKQGKIPGCGCAVIKKQRKPTDDWQWGGCSDNVKFGERETKRFIDKLEKGNDARTAFNLHNNEVGRKVQ